MFTLQERSASASQRPALGAKPPPRSADARKTIREAVFRTKLVDTHEHLVEESERLQGAPRPYVPCDDWALLFSHYLDSDLLVAGMSKADLDRFLSPQIDPADKWSLLAPHWPAVKNTGYTQAVRLAIRALYGVEELSPASVRKVQAGYESTRRRGFYQRILQDFGGIESCQVNHLGQEPFRQSQMPDLLMQDISIVGMFAGPAIGVYSQTGRH